jgi:tetratricopeptide (TPR) repeat protein
MISINVMRMRGRIYAASFNAGLSLRLIGRLFLFCLLAVATSNAQTPRPTPQPAPHRPLPKLSSGARGFDFEKGSKDASTRLIAVGGGWGAEEAPKARLTSKTARGYYKFGDKLLENLEFEKSIPPLERAVKMNPNYLAAYESLGYAYAYDGVSASDGSPNEEYMLKRYRQAIGAFEQARRLAPKKNYLHLNLGVLYFNIEQYQKAVDSFSRGLQLSPKTEDFTIPIMEEASLTDTYEFIARAYEFMGQKELAVSSYQQALKVNPDESKADPYWMLGQLYEELDQPDLALASYLGSVSTTREWRRWVHDEEVFSRIGELYAAKQKYGEG